MIEFRTLGSLDLKGDDDRELEGLLTQPKRVALLTYLCIAKPPGFHRRDTLLGLLWPDSDHVHARTSLRSAVHALRHSLGDASIISRGDDEIRVNEKEIDCDAVLFEKALAAGKYAAALTLYNGDVLPGFFLNGAPDFEQWLAHERARLRAAAAHAAQKAAKQSEADNDFNAAIDYARTAVELTHSDERLFRDLVELLDRAGDRAGAMKECDVFCRQLKAEYGAEPAPETRALIRRLRST